MTENRGTWSIVKAGMAVELFQTPRSFTTTSSTAPTPPRPLRAQAFRGRARAE